MKKQRRDIMKEQEGRMKAFAEEYLTPKNILASVGVASLAGLATYSTVRAFKNEKLINRIKKELNFGSIKSNISSRFNELGIGTKKSNNARNKKSEERGPIKKTQKSQSRKSKPKAKKRYVTG